MLLGAAGWTEVRHTMKGDAATLFQVNSGHVEHTVYVNHRVIGGCNVPTSTRSGDSLSQAHKATDWRKDVPRFASMHRNLSLFSCNFQPDNAAALSNLDPAYVKNLYDKELRVYHYSEATVKDCIVSDGRFSSQARCFNASRKDLSSAKAYNYAYNCGRQLMGSVCLGRKRKAECLDTAVIDLETEPVEEIWECPICRDKQAKCVLGCGHVLCQTCNLFTQDRCLSACTSLCTMWRAVPTRMSGMPSLIDALIVRSLIDCSRSSIFCAIAPGLYTHDHQHRAVGPVGEQERVIDEEMGKILHSILRSVCVVMVHLDNILVHAASFDDTLANL
ncbi:hypothetical protein AAFF_G00171550 [Aldrovandia affinis]|uniref:RING-type domain-containing protein n=1 Tax=Aldrovandia affinis TaxID=143900 RepID=A0AAD7WWT1_9TELE|nr:hypothetical protein AAFF_G00171550 [Aldrovandia affinis]